MRSEQFDVPNHVFGGQHIVEQHEGSQHVRSWRLLRRIHNASMGDAGCVQPQKVRILRKHDAAFLRRSFSTQMGWCRVL